MGKNLVIVESPAKAKTIESYLGKDYIVKSSFGHVRDLASKGLAIDIEGGFIPNYEVSEDKKAVIKDLKKLAKEAEMVWLATDEDREGEAISWHLKEALSLDDKKIKRITFNEITKTAVTKAINNPREINIDLVNAQQARRVLDRLVGFELSPVLWKKVKPSLSAGRVQSVAVRLIVEREKEIQAFKSTSSYKVSAIFTTPKGEAFKAELKSNFDTLDKAKAFLEKCVQAQFNVSSLNKRPGKKSPAAPFTTSTLQQEASRKLGYSVARTMQVAQKLYESGKITYMRTDSVNLSEDALKAIKDEVVSYFGGEYANPKKYYTKSKSAQEAHEAIRPTDMSVHTINDDSAEKKLYELIWKRTIASQMADAELEKTTITIESKNVKEIFEANGEVIKFDGFLKVYLESTDEEEQGEEGMLPRMEEGEQVDYKTIEAVQKFTRPAARYTEASLVKKLEELGIGRPSTYAPTISTIQKRGYVEKGEKEGEERTIETVKLDKGKITEATHTEKFGSDKGKLTPTDIGTVVNDFLIEHFKEILDYNFTASVEEEFDEIANGLVEWTKMIKKFYGPFHKSVENTLEHSERASGERLLGMHPENGRNVYARIGRFGPMIQIGDQDDEDKKFASLLKEQSINTITLEEALELFKLPRTLGEYKGEEMQANVGRFGPYVRWGKTFVSIKKDSGEEPMSITLEKAIEMLETHLEAKKNADINKFETKEGLIEVLNGRFGPYIKMGKKNFKIPKDKEPAKLTLEDCLEIINTPVKPKRGK
ncbi:MAG: type I DNA topoisomerase [Bacteroidia bacterium]